MKIKIDIYVKSIYIITIQSSRLLKIDFELFKQESKPF